MLLISILTVTHNQLRNIQSLKNMIEYVKRGGLFSKEDLEKYSLENSLNRVSPLIQITRFEDGALYIHDGHHRVVSCCLANKLYLFDEEYEISDWTYQQYIELSCKNDWYTPFDPRIHCRTHDFNQFKKEARQKFSEDPISAEKWVFENTQRYRTERLIKSVNQLAFIK